MIIKINKRRLLLIVLLLLALAAACVVLFRHHQARAPQLVMGGTLQASASADTAAPASAQEAETALVYARFRRPNNCEPYANRFTYQDFAQPQDGSDEISTAEDAVAAYWGILSQASNMAGFTGGCGSIGDGLNPYPLAYGLLTPAMQAGMSQKAFIDSFRGIGYITLLNLLPLDYAKGTYMVEIETIQGEPDTGRAATQPGGRFVYYYGVVSTQQVEQGYRISAINLYAEDFLCAPEHSWFYLSDAVVGIVYGEQLGLIDAIDKTQLDDHMVYVYASGGGKEYRFDFVRLTNGHDILLHENIYEDGVWKSAALPTEDWRLKLQS